MFVIYNEKLQLKPIKVWLEDSALIEPECLQQGLNLSNLPFLHKHVALMPDTHSGYGMPIGGVIAAEGVIIPNAVGVDIGCGMSFVQTSIHKEEFKEDDLNNLVGQIMRNIPTGFNHHKKFQECKTLDEFCRDNDLSSHLQIKYKDLFKEIERGYYQIGTLGGGNHFIELQEDQEGFVCIMLHSGSRNFGLKIAKHFNGLAKVFNEEWYTMVPKKYDLAFLPTSSAEGKDYIKWMSLALDFAQENRQKMLEIVKDEVCRRKPQITFSNELNAHHNYAAFENHYGKDVWVHRKGAISAREGEMGIIPGAMGSYSYIVKGKGNPESFHSCSHGAGRKMSRKKANEEFSVESTIRDLKELGVILGKAKKGDVGEESRFAYKDIEAVISNELDLVEPVKKLKTLVVIKG